MLSEPFGEHVTETKSFILTCFESMFLILSTNLRMGLLCFLPLPTARKRDMSKGRWHVMLAGFSTDSISSCAINYNIYFIANLDWLKC